MTTPSAAPRKGKGATKGTTNSRGLNLVGLREIATLLEVAPRTPTIWRNRSTNGEMDPPFPAPDGFVSGNRPVWDRKRVVDWARKTGRLPSQRHAEATTTGADG